MTARLVRVLCGLGVLIASVGARAEQQAAADDWPQWRGPNRNGTGPSSAKLAEAWPKEGAKLLWKSQPIPGLPDGGPVGEGMAVGGCGSLAVSGGKAFFYAHCKFKKEKVVFTTTALTELGWAEGMAEELAKKVDAAYAKRLSLSGAKLEKHIEEFLATLPPAEAQPFGKLIRDNLLQRWEDRFSWGLLVRLAKMRDQEYPSIEEWNRRSGDLLHGHGEHAGEIRSLLNAQGSTYTDTVVCLDAATGKELWKKDFPGNPITPYTNGFNASSTPTVVGERCYVQGSAGLYGLATKDGAVLWQVKTGLSNSSPLVADGAVYVCSLEGLQAYRAEDGQPLWTQPALTNHSSSPVGWTSGGKSYILCDIHRKYAKNSELACVEPGQGTVLWRVLSSGGESFSTPAVSGDLVANFGKGRLTVYRITPQKAEKAWESKLTFDERGGSAVIYQDHVYTVGGGYGNSGAHCHDLKTGELKWQQKYEHTEGASPIVADGKVFAFLHERPQKCVMFRATPEKYEELGRIPGAPDLFNGLSSPAVAGGRLYLRLKGAVACYDLMGAGK